MLVDKIFLGSDPSNESHWLPIADILQAGSENPILQMIASLNGLDGQTVRLGTGIYQIGHFGSTGFPHPEFFKDTFETSLAEYAEYGVCDDAQNVKDHLLALQDPTRKFIVTLTPVHRKVANKGKGGGWRWHKWGPYIGKQEPLAEYIDDEPNIELVYVYHVHELHSHVEAK